MINLRGSITRIFDAVSAPELAVFSLNRLLAPLVALVLTFTLVATVPSLAQSQLTDKPKHPILSRLFIWLIRSNCKPKQVTPQQAEIQNLLQQNDDYKRAVKTLTDRGYQLAPGEIKQIRVPDWHKSKLLFFFIPIKVVYLPTSFLLQPAQKTQMEKYGVILAVEQEQHVSTAAYIDASNFGDLGKINAEVPKQTLVHYLKADMDHCGVPCLNTAARNAPIFVAMLPLGMHVALGAYLTRVLGNKECGGCILNGFAQSILDYATQTRIGTSNSQIQESGN